MSTEPIHFLQHPRFFREFFLLSKMSRILVKNSSNLTMTTSFLYLAEDPSDEFVALRDLVSLELCHEYLPDLFSKESILKTNRVAKEMIDQVRNICKLTKVIFFVVFDLFIYCEFLF